ncbi:MAG: hypothetical protein WC683_04330 [bacterium]
MNLIEELEEYLASIRLRGVAKVADDIQAIIDRYKLSERETALLVKDNLSMIASLSSISLNLSLAVTEAAMQIGNLAREARTERTR